MKLCICADPENCTEPVPGTVCKKLNPGVVKVAEKVRYVKRQGQTRVHHCHWPGCTKQVPPAMWGCREHWYRLPKPLRDRIWATYRPGQEISGTPTPAYIEAAKAVQHWIKENG